MFEFTDSKNRIICRSLFLSLCVLPTAITFYALFHLNDKAEWERAIQAQTRMAIRFQSMETPRPSEYRLNHVTFADPELAEIGSLTQVVVRYGIPNQIEVIGTASLTTHGLAALVEKLRTQILPHFDQPSHWEVKVPRVEIASSYRKERFQFLGPVTVGLRQTPEGKTLAMIRVQDSQLASSDGRSIADWLRIDLEWNGSQSLVDVNTGDHRPLATWLAEGFGPECHWLRAENTGFLGSARWTCGTEGATGKAQGQLVNVHLGDLTLALANPIVGIADIELQSLEFQNGKIGSALGRLTSTQLRCAPTTLAVISQLLGRPSALDPNQDLTLINLKFLLNRGKLESTVSCQQGTAQIANSFSTTIQEPVYWLTTPEQLGARFDWANLNNRGVGILGHFQLEQVPFQTADRNKETRLR